MTKALKKITSVLLIAICATACSADGDIRQPGPDISDTASVTASEEPKESGTEGAVPADETTAATTAPVTTTTTTAAVTTTTPPVTTTTTAAATPKPPAAATTTTAAAPSVYYSTDFTEEVFLLVNQIRAEYGLPAYKRLDALSNAAQKRANEISGYYSHVRPDGQPSYSVLKEYGLNYSLTGENIAAGQMTPQSVVDAWMSSTMGHREAILSSKYQYMGVGYICLTSGDKQGYKYYWTQEFYSPL